MDSDKETFFANDNDFMGEQYPLLGCLALFAASLSAAEARLNLKIRKDTSSFDAVSSEPVVARRRAAGRRHVILQFREAPQAIEKEELMRRGIRILGAVPESALMVSIPDETSVEDLNLAWAGALGPDEKVSPEIAIAAALEETPSHYVVDFHADVDADEINSMILEHGLERVEHPDLLAHQRLVKGPLSQVLRLVEWDEVAYVFPASEDLIEGRHVIGCAGAQTEDGVIGQYIAKVGDGWDGPGMNSAELGYFFRSLTSKLDEQATSEEIVRALAEWARYAKLTFAPSAAPGMSRSIDILFASGAHGDGYAFDGAGKVIAHTFYPAPPNSEPVAGDMHMDADENWHIGSDTDVFSVALHELGHALGLGHSDKPGSVMYPYYRRVTKLADEDIAAIRSLYAEQTATATGGDTPQSSPLALTIQSPASSPVTTASSSLLLSGITSGGSSDPVVSWSSDRGYSGTAQGSRSWSIPAAPLSVGNNVISVTATDSTPTTVSASIYVIRQAEILAPTLAITSPTASGTYTTSSSSVVLAGTASHASGISRVAWNNSRGGNGVANGTTSWSTPAISLSTGANTMTVTAYEPGGQSASKKLVVNYANTVRDTVAPSLRITYPGSTTVATTASTIALRGTAGDNVGVESVRWLTSTGKSGTAAGKTIWTTEPIPLYVGTNAVTVQAFDAAGNMSWRSVTVTRR